MALTDTQLWSLSQKMKVPLVFCNFKDRLEREKLKYGKYYIINMENEFDENGHRNDGSHYCSFQVNKYPNGKVEGFYFDPFGQPPPQIVEKFCGLPHLPYNQKDIQSLMNSACGWYCIALGHFVNSYEGRSKDLYSDLQGFTDLFEDLSKSTAHHKNEWVLKHFFRSADESKRTPIEVFGEGGKHISYESADPNSISGEDEDAGTYHGEGFKMKVHKSMYENHDEDN